VIDHLFRVAVEAPRGENGLQFLRDVGDNVIGEGAADGPVAVVFSYAAQVGELYGVFVMAL
jgi:hypothetical protein